MNSSEQLSIFRIPGRAAYPAIVPASADREWMDIGTGGWANRCLPLRIANQAGWYILSEDEFEVEWDGTNGMDSLKFHFLRPPSEFAPFNMVGYGIVSWVPPLLFRTPPGMNLWVRGPANEPKDGVSPLEGLVETDWLPYPFTINWKITRPHTKVRFSYGDAICFLTPIRRYEAERLEPIIRNLESEPELDGRYRLWHENRMRAREIQGADGSQGHLAVADQGHYIRGEIAAGRRFEEHQTKLNVQPVRELDAPQPISDIKESSSQLASDITARGWNGMVTLTQQDVKITRPTGLRRLFTARGIPDTRIPVKKIISVQYKDNVSLGEMALIRFVLPDMAPALEYKAALRDPYTVLFDKDQLENFQWLYSELQRRMVPAKARPSG